ncbi:MAG: serine hydrolase domain-containing protein [Candidatus Entotheonellia bacterium]
MANTQAIDHVLSRAVNAQDVPGVVAMAATDQGVMYEGAFGTRELGKDAAMTPDTVVWIDSMTKAITAAAAMQLVERGQLQLDSPAADVVPELAKAQVLEGFDTAGTPQLRAAKRAMTLKHLLTHTAGFSYDSIVVMCPAGLGIRPLDQAESADTDEGGVMEWPIVAPAPGVTAPAAVCRELCDHQCQVRHVQQEVTGLVGLPHKSVTTMARGLLDSGDKTNRCGVLAAASWRAGGQTRPQHAPGATERLLYRLHRHAAVHL